MYANCITKSPIAWGEKVKLFFICPNKNNYLQGLICENQFSAIGAPMDAIYKEKMNFKNIPNENINFTGLDSLMEMSDNAGADLPTSFSNIQNQIQKGNIYVNRYTEKVFVNFMAIKESIYNEIINDENIKLINKGNFKTYKENLRVQLDNLIELDQKKEGASEDELIKIFTDFTIMLGSLLQDFMVYLNIGHKEALSRIKNDFDVLTEASFVIQVLEEQGYLMTPTSVHQEGNNKKDFLTELIKIQEDKEIFEEALTFKEIKI